MGTLFVVATPIGNLQDISRRAIAVLGAVGLVAAEDTRVAGVLLRHYGIQARLLSYNEHNRGQRIPEILAALAEADVALVSDAGTPAISDPGVELVAAARGAGFRVEAVPGPSAVIAALSVAGLRTATWRFVGFLPRKAGDLRRLLEQAAEGAEALVGYESPARLQHSLGVIAAVLPVRRIAVCRELTKVHEEVFVGTAMEALEHFLEVRGEIVVIVEGASGARQARSMDSADEAAIARDVEAMRAAGLTQSQAAALLNSRYGVSRRRAYELWLGAPK